MVSTAVLLSVFPSHTSCSRTLPCWDPAVHPGLKYVAKGLKVSLIGQVEKGGDRRPTLEIQAQSLVDPRAMPPSERLEITGAAVAARDPKYRNQQQEPLGVAHTTTIATIGDRLEEDYQIISISHIDGSICGLWHVGKPFPPKKANAV